MRIQHNVMAMNAYRNYNNNTSALAKNLEKLSSGYKINRAGDDAAGLAISEKMRAQITGLTQAQSNAKSGINLIQTAEGAMQEVHDMLNRMVKLADQSANGTYDNDVDRVQLQKEVDQLKSEIDRIADSANFNGIKLLDGSLDANGSSSINASSAITKLQTNKWTPKGAAEAFESTFINERPAAATSQTMASFVVSLDDIAISAGTSGTHTVKLVVGNATLTFTSSDSAALTATAIAAGLASAGYALNTSDTTNNTITTSSGANIKIGDNIYAMSASNGKLTFTQVNDTGNTGTIVNPDFKVSVEMTAAKGGTATGKVNPQVQVTQQGIGVGASQQARVDVAIDFAKLKEGDTLTVGDQTFQFTFDAANTASNAIDLSAIFESEADLANADKQAEAMVAITQAMGTRAGMIWSVGNGGVEGGKGILTLQSLSSYADGTVNIAGATASNAPTCKMDTEANVMKQIYATSPDRAASVSFELDVTKIKEGNTFTIDGQTFEFTDGANVTTKGNIAIDLSDLGISSGLLESQTAEVMAAMKSAVATAFDTSKYTLSVSDNKFTITSVDNTGTTGVFEQRVAAKVELGREAYEGKALTLQIGDTSDEFNQLKVSIADMHAGALGLGDINIANQDDAAAAVDAIKAAINMVSDVRGTLGATQNRLDHTINNLSVMTENIQDAESTIRDTDVADEMMAYTKNNILIQSAQAMLAQANQVPQGVLQLLQ